MKILDLKNKVCPVPVIETKKVLETCDTNETVLSIVDNEIAMQNVSKLAKELGYNFQTKTVTNEHYEVIIIKGLGNEEVEKEVSDTVFIIDKLEMGHGDDELGLSLRKAMIHTIQDIDVLPSHILVYNSGVKMLEEQYNMIEDLYALERLGINILFCGACLTAYNLVDQLKAGSSTNMYEILSISTKAKKVIKL